MATKATVQAAAAPTSEPETLEPQDAPTPEPEVPAEPQDEPEVTGHSKTEVLQEQLFSLARMKGRNIALTPSIIQDVLVLELSPGSGPVHITGTEIATAEDLGALAAAKIELAS